MSARITSYNVCYTKLLRAMPKELVLKGKSILILQKKNFAELRESVPKLKNSLRNNFV